MLRLTGIVSGSSLTAQFTQPTGITGAFSWTLDAGGSPSGSFQSSVPNSGNSQLIRLPEGLICVTAVREWSNTLRGRASSKATARPQRDQQRLSSAPPLKLAHGTDVLVVAAAVGLLAEMNRISRAISTLSQARCRCHDWLPCGWVRPQRRLFTPSDRRVDSPWSPRARSLPERRKSDARRDRRASCHSPLKIGRRMAPRPTRTSRVIARPQPRGCTSHGDRANRCAPRAARVAVAKDITWRARLGTCFAV